MAYEAFSFTPQGEQALLLSGVLLSSEDEIGPVLRRLSISNATEPSRNQWARPRRSSRSAS